MYRLQHVVLLQNRPHVALCQGDTDVSAPHELCIQIVPGPASANLQVTCVHSTGTHHAVRVWDHLSKMLLPDGQGKPRLHRRAYPLCHGRYVQIAHCIQPATHSNGCSPVTARLSMLSSLALTEVGNPTTGKRRLWGP